MTTRGSLEHRAAAARQFLNDPDVQALRARSVERCMARIRAVSTNDAEECRGAVAQMQGVLSAWSMFEQLVREDEKPDRKVEVV